MMKRFFNRDPEWIFAVAMSVSMVGLVAMGILLILFPLALALQLLRELKR